MNDEGKSNIAIICKNLGGVCKSRVRALRLSRRARLDGDAAPQSLYYNSVN